MKSFIKKSIIYFLVLSTLLFSFQTAASANTLVNGLNLLPTVDNSVSKYFPPIRDQGSLYSCTSFASTYYQSTYMNAMARDWDVKADTDNSKKFSPKWTYNLSNGGSNQAGSGSYRLFFEQGLATWKDFPYNDNYTEWPTDISVWKNARNFMPDKIGTVEIMDGTNTPVQDVNDETLNTIKQLISNGYIFTISTDIRDWNYKPIKSASNSNIIGRAACYMMDNHCLEAGGHTMTLVGYDDSIWVDINNDGNKDIGENGAFKIANSYGDKWDPQMDDGTFSGRGDGFTWLCYDALNKVSSVHNAPVPVNGRYEALGQANGADWITFKSSNTASLMAEVNITHAKRNQLKYELGYSETSESRPSKTIEPYEINNESGEYPFSGSIALDYTNFFYGKDLTQTPKKWYLKVTDINPDGIKATINSFKLYDPKTGTQVAYPQTNITVGDTVGSNSVTLCIEYKPSSTLLSENNWTIKNGIDPALNMTYSGQNIVNYNGKLYVCAINNNDPSKGALLEYNPITEKWFVFINNIRTFGSYDQAVVCNSKLYIFSGTFGFVFDMNNKDKPYEIIELPVDGPRSMYSALASGNGKIYIIGGKDAYSNALKSVFEYDPSSTINDGWKRLSDLQYPRETLTSTILDGKIYVFGGMNKNKTEGAVEIYDPISGGRQVSTLPNNLSSNRYEYKAISMNNKIYLIAYYLDISYVYEFDPNNATWKEMHKTPGFVEFFNTQTFDGKLYVLYNGGKNVLEFNPYPKLPAPVISPVGGTYCSIQTVSMSCATSDATIRYTTDGTNPTSTSPVYTGPIKIAGTKTVKAYATKTGMTNSNISSTSFEMIFVVGDVNGDACVNVNDFNMLKSYLQGVINDFPVDNDLWVGDLDGDGYINAVDYALMNQYIIGQISYFPKEKIKAPTFSPVGGTYTTTQSVTLTSATSGATIRYTTDGSTPTCSSALYTAPISVSSSMTIKAIAMKSGMVNSDISSATYTINR